MSQYDNNLTGSLFKNDKGDNEKRPDYKGQCEIDGVQYWISSWILEAGPNTKRPGERFMSLKFEAKEGQAPKPAPAPTQSQGPDLTDDIPF